jgi:hypothetical protein
MARLLRPRVWMLLAAVVVVAIAIELSGVGPRWRDYRRKAHESSITVRSALNLARESDAKAARHREAAKRAANPDEAALRIRDAEDAEDTAADWRRLAAWNERVEGIYQEASSHPWGPPPRVPAFGAVPHRNQLSP